MKRPFTIIVLTLLATFAYAQDSRDKIKALEDFLLNHGFLPTSQYQRGGAAYWGYYSYSYEYIVQPPYPDEGMTEKEVQQLYDRFDSCYAMKRKAFEAVWDSVRLMVNDIVQDADGSYIKEKHQSGNDTIDYRIYFIRTDPESMAYHSPMDSIYPPQRNESVNLDYIQGLLDMGTTRRYEIHASYYFFISEEHALPAQAEEFDVDRFKNYLTEVLAPMLRQKGVRQYPVYWQYEHTPLPMMSLLMKDSSQECTTSYRMYSLIQQTASSAILRPKSGSTLTNIANKKLVKNNVLNTRKQ